MRGIVGDPDSGQDRCADAGRRPRQIVTRGGCAMLGPVDRHKPLLTFRSLTFRPDRHRHDPCPRGVISWIDRKDLDSRGALASSCSKGPWQAFAALLGPIGQETWPQLRRLWAGLLRSWRRPRRAAAELLAALAALLAVPIPAQAQGNAQLDGTSRAISVAFGSRSLTAVDFPALRAVRRAGYLFTCMMMCTCRLLYLFPV